MCRRVRGSGQGMCCFEVSRILGEVLMGLSLWLSPVGLISGAGVGFGQVMCRIEDSPMIGEVFMGLRPWIFLAEVNRAASVWVRSSYVPHRG